MSDSTTTVAIECERFASALGAKNYSSRTVDCYVSILRKFLRYYRKTPKRISANEIITWIASKNCAATKAQCRGALLNYYTHVVGQPKKFDKIPNPKKDNRSPQILPVEVVIDRIGKINNLKHRMIISVLYGAGLRLSELLDLRITDVDGHRCTLFVRHGKGGKDRVVPVSGKLINDLRKYFKEYRPTSRLFEGANRSRYSSTSVQKICRKYMYCNPHLLRHCNLTHLIESGVHISEVAKRAGHSKIETTHSTYSHIATTFNPLTLLAA